MQIEHVYTIAFMTGLLGSGHCIGMCGGLVSAFFMKFGDKGQGVLPYAAYHSGRIAIYLLLGIIAGLIGLAVTTTGTIGKTQAILRIIAGLFVILLGMDILGVGPLRMNFSFLPLNTLRNQFMGAVEKGPLKGALIAGLINGFMPCSLTLAVAVSATTAGGPVPGGLLMLAFGLGTLPSMLFVSALFGRLGTGLRGRLLKIAALFVIVLGMGTLLEGVTYFGIADGFIN